MEGVADKMAFVIQGSSRGCCHSPSWEPFVHQLYFLPRCAVLLRFFFLIMVMHCSTLLLYHYNKSHAAIREEGGQWPMQRAGKDRKQVGKGEAGWYQLPLKWLWALLCVLNSKMYVSYNNPFIIFSLSGMICKIVLKLVSNLKAHLPLTHTQTQRRKLH